MKKIKVNKETTASFDIDAQKGFTPLCPKELPVEDGDQIVDELNAQAKLANFRIGSKDVHPSNAVWIATEDEPQFTPIEGYKNADIRWNAHCMNGTKGAELLDGLPKVCEYNYFIFKGIEPELHPYSPVYHDLEKKMSTGVIEWLKQNGVKTVIIGGLATNFCAGSGARDLKDAGFNVIFNIVATRGIGTKKEVEAWVDTNLKQYGIEVVENASQIEVEIKNYWFSLDNQINNNVFKIKDVLKISQKYYSGKNIKEGDKIIYALLKTGDETCCYISLEESEINQIYKLIKSPSNDWPLFEKI